MVGARKKEDIGRNGFCFDCTRPQRCEGDTEKRSITRWLACRPNMMCAQSDDATYLSFYIHEKHT